MADPEEVFWCDCLSLLLVAVLESGQHSFRNACKTQGINIIKHSFSTIIKFPMQNVDIA